MRNVVPLLSGEGVELSTATTFPLLVSPTAAAAAAPP